MTTSAAVTTAKRVKIELGSLTFDGYMIEGQTDRDGLPVFGFSMTDCAMLLGLTEDVKKAQTRYTEKTTSKEAQTRFPEGFEVHRNLKVKELTTRATKVNLVTIEAFSKLLRLVSNPKADVIGDALAGYSLRKIFSRSFGEVFTDEMAESWIAARFVGIETRNDWTQAIKVWLDSSEASDNKRKWIYVNCSNKLNRALTGQPAKYWTEKLGCDPSTLRNYWNDRHLHDIEAIENLAAKILERNPQDPELALDQAIELLNAKVNPSPCKEEKGYDRLTYMREYMRNKRAKEKAN